MQDASRTTVLVLDQVAQTLAIVRSLGRAGYRVMLGRNRRQTEAERSRYCDEIWPHPDFTEQAAFATALETLLDSRPDIRIIFPAGETSGAVLCQLPELRARDIQCVMPAPDLFRQCRDKRGANLLAEQAGLSVPATSTVTSLPELEAAANAIGYPLIVKPCHSTRPLLGRKALVCHSPTAQQQAIPTWPAEHADLIVQQYIAGPVEQCDFVAQDGRLLLYFQYRSLRTDALDGTGYGIDLQSQPMARDLIDACTAFVSTHKYCGPGLLQFIRSAHDGSLHFIENNPRLSAGIDQTMACGLDAPLAAIAATVPTRRQNTEDRLSCAQRPAAAAQLETPDAAIALPAYRVGDRTHWLTHDLEAWLRNRTVLTPRERHRWQRATWRSWRAANRQMDLCGDDPMPVFWRYGRLSKRLASALLQPSLRRKRAPTLPVPASAEPLQGSMPG